ncbi:MAG: type 4a pilus biogenesis protein PilO [Gemmatimonadota bacterium]|nr:type 4a pilus biogenesis protein PilO [Gemmatimonadota bacterium]MDE2983816.1 type 4a pilus biogenesis protein PilO [Gemmatimonadota bacterium]
MSLLPSDPVRRGAVLCVLLAVSGLYFAHTYLFAPSAARTESLRLRLERLEEGNRGANRVAALGDAELEQRLALYREHIARLEALIPANEEVAALLDAISDEERRAGIEMTMMRPEPVRPGEFYDRLSYQVTVRGGYHAVGSFLAAIASLDRIVAPGDLVIAPVDASAGDQVEAGSILAGFRIRTYVATARTPGPAESSQGTGDPQS